MRPPPLPLFLLLLLLFLLSASRTSCQTPSVTPSHPCPELTSFPTARLNNSIPTNLTFLYFLFDINFGPIQCIAVPISKEHILTLSACSAFPNLYARIEQTEVPLESPTVSAALAVLRLSQPLGTSAPIRLNTVIGAPSPSQIARVFGRADASLTSPSFGFVDMRILDQDDCVETTVDEEMVTELERAFCLRREGCGPCFGDGGAPAVDYNDEGEPVVLGLAVRMTRCGGDDGVDVFEGVAGYLRWMKDEVGVEFEQGDLGEDAELSPSPSELDIGTSSESAMPSASVSPREFLEGVDLGNANSWGWSLLAALGGCVLFGFFVWVRHRNDSVRDFTTFM